MTVAAGQSVTLERLSRRYGPVRALDAVSLEVRAGEFLALLGPSGSGKTTLLMAIAGFERPDAGRILIGGRAIDGLAPYRRDIGIVFQRYALFPHMNVAENLAYPLRRRGLRNGEIAARVEETLRLVRLEGFAARTVDQLSGGQQQRVAIARAVIFRPPVLLLDEPMSALDRKLRGQMQMELKLLHRELGTTILLVTHDQEEALSMADRIAVLNHGRVRQVGTPEELYHAPADAFVADFIGRMNFLPLAAQTPPCIAGFSVPLGEALAPDAIASPGAQAGVRPEHILLGAPGEPGEPCRIIETAFGGASQTVLIEACGHRLTAELPGGATLRRPGEEARLRFLPGVVRLFAPLTSHPDERDSHDR